MGNHGNRIYGAAAASTRLFCDDVMSFEEHEQELKEYQAFIEELGYASFKKAILENDELRDQARQDPIVYRM